MKRRIFARIMLICMLLPLFAACGEKRTNGDREKAPVLFPIPEGNEEKLAVTGRAVYTGDEGIDELYAAGDGLHIVRGGMSARLDESFQPEEWKKEEDGDAPRAVYGDYAFYGDRVLAPGGEIPLEVRFGESFIGFWSFDGIVYLAAQHVDYDPVEIEKAVGRCVVLYPVSEKGLGEPVRVEGLAADGMTTGSDGKWNYFTRDNVLCRTDGKTIQDLGNVTSFGVNMSMLRSIEPLDENRVLLLSDRSLILLTIGDTAAEGRSGSRGTVVLGVTRAYGFVPEMVSAYNLMADDKVEIREYQSVEKLNLAILNQEVDVVADSDADVLAGYAAKGLLTPLEEVIGDTLSSGELFQNVIDAGRIGGKTYMIPDAARLCGMLLPAALVEAKKGRFADMKDLIETLDGLEKQNFYNLMTKEIALNNFLFNGVSAWVDRDAGTCRFEDENFIALLKLCGRYAPDQDTVSANESSGRPLFYPYHQMENPLGFFKMFFYEDVKGSEKTASPYGLDGMLFPSPTGKNAGFALIPDMVFSVTASGGGKAGAGEFLDYLLSPECQDLTDKMIVNAAGMPVRISSFRKMAEKEVNELKQYDYPVNWEEKAKQGYDLFQSADHYGGGDSEICKVVREEGLRYLRGEITAEKAAEYIQNRVSIYLAEQG